MTTFDGERLRDCREQEGLTEEYVADYLGIPQELLHQWEAGEEEPTNVMFVKLSELLNVTADYLVGLVNGRHGYMVAGELSLAEKELICAYRANYRGIVLFILFGKTIALK